MFDVIMAIAFAIVAIRVCGAVRRERAVFREFGQSLALVPHVALYPVVSDQSTAF